MKVEYSETSVLATANQASKEAPAGRLPISPVNWPSTTPMGNSHPYNPFAAAGIVCGTHFFKAAIMSSSRIGFAM